MIKAKKRWGQNFISDRNILQKIVDLSQIDHQNVLEIGPGMGGLTRILAKEAKKLLCYEIDEDLHEFLDEIEEKFTNTKIIYQDFLANDSNSVIKEYFSQEPVILVSNLPYYITTQVIMSFLTNSSLQRAIIMVQKEVGERIISLPNNKEYGQLSVNIQGSCWVKKLLNIKRGLFNPVPNVDSILISLEKYAPLDPEFVNFNRLIFANKRKTLYNNLLANLHLSSNQASQLLMDLKINSNSRSEQLNIDTIKELYNSWKKLPN
ncbi:MAG: 16S rRNA (adenine(1518)-N(6)/adenine(1519)-N(6))-dimethyltransferase RsmA [Acholeplasmatales bacterium]|jgi:16S rRNA (adenine1518-N6/adenine1519-N6)-dimethyltransferase|nr:16S rRNA (adenine(1518)-N(6)/adenine(1519)-N(6))-dimethyltransferase RsmA [Acholeplasmatales bacterium]